MLGIRPSCLGRALGGAHSSALRLLLLALPAARPQLLPVQHVGARCLSGSTPSCAALPPLPAPRPPRRVVVTGIGLVTPLGVGAAHVWARLLRGDVGTVALPAERYGALPSRVAALVPRGTGAGEFNAAAVVDKAGARTQGPDYIAFALAAAREALTQAGLIVGGAGAGADALRPGVVLDRDRAGVAIGSGIGGIAETAETAEQLVEGSAETKLPPGGRPATEAGYRRVSPFFVPRVLANMPAGHVSIRYGLRGPNHAAATACASGAHAVGDAFRFIKHGDADVMLAGGTEACVSPLALARRPPTRPPAGRAAPLTPRATALCWGRAPPCSCWRPRSTRARAGRRSSLKSAATARAATRTTSRRPRTTARARTAAWPPRWPRAASPRRTSTT